MSRPELRHVVGDVELRLGSLLARWGEAAAAALADGRVFVDGTRTLDPELVLPAGSVVELYAARESAAEIRVLGRFGDLVAIEKPVGIATEPDHSGIGSCVVTRAAELLDIPRERVHALSRLDVGVSGVVLLGLSSEIRRTIEGLRDRGELTRRYVAIAARAPEPLQGTFHGAIGRAARGRRRVEGADARAAETRYFTAARARDAALLGLTPVTGRTHQLRVHCAHAGAPLYGDASYGGPRRVTLPDGSVEVVRRVALHAAWVNLPFTGGVRVEAPIPSDLESLWASLGGEARAFELALGDPLGPGA